MIAAQDRVRVQRALAAMPQKEKDLLRWLFFEERDKDDVCRELKIDRNYLRVMLHRAKARFREQFEQGIGLTMDHQQAIATHAAERYLAE